MSQSSPGYFSKRDVQLEGGVELQVFVGVGWCDVHIPLHVVVSKCGVGVFDSTK